MGFLTKLSLVIVAWGIYGDLQKKDVNEVSSIYMLILTGIIMFW